MAARSNWYKWNLFYVLPTVCVQPVSHVYYTDLEAPGKDKHFVRCTVSILWLDYVIDYIWSEIEVLA